MVPLQLCVQRCSCAQIHKRIHELIALLFHFLGPCSSEVWGSKSFWDDAIASMKEASYTFFTVQLSPSIIRRYLEKKCFGNSMSSGLLTYVIIGIATRNAANMGVQWTYLIRFLHKSPVDIDRVPNSRWNRGSNWILLVLGEGVDALQGDSTNSLAA